MGKESNQVLKNLIWLMIGLLWTGSDFLLKGKLDVGSLHGDMKVWSQFRTHIFSLCKDRFIDLNDLTSNLLPSSFSIFGNDIWDAIDQIGKCGRLNVYSQFLRCEFL